MGYLVNPAETGLYYLNSRYYDAEVGRFISADTTELLSISGDFFDKNLYIYCDNNPILRKDEEGRIWVAIAAFPGLNLLGTMAVGARENERCRKVYRSSSLWSVLNNYINVCESV